MANNTNKRGSSDTNFTNLTFDEIKQRLVTRAKTYYPDTYQDFNDTSFGSMMLDMVALVSEQLNFYTQFVANENYLETTRTVQGYTSAAAREGIQISNKYTSVGLVKVFARVPASASLTGPDKDYQFTILRGTVFSNSSSCVFSKLPTFASNDPQKLSNSDPTHSHPKPSNGKISSPPKFYIDPLFRVFDFTSVNSRDVATQHLIKQGLYAQDISPFDGSAHLFAG